MIPDTLQQVADVIARDFLPVITLCVSSGVARIRCDHPIFYENAQAIAIASCILSERGFETSVFKDMEHIPVAVSSSGAVTCTKRPVYIFEVHYPKGRR